MYILKLGNKSNRFGISLWKPTKKFPWQFGYFHIYYDGDNYGFHLGPLVFEWGNNGW